MADNVSVCSTVAGPPHVIWIRSEHETEDEAIRIDLPYDAYVSDILIKAPTVMNLSGYRPVELQVVRDGIPLSNRSALASLVAGDSGEPSAQLSFVVRPRAASLSPPAAAPVTRADPPPTASIEKSRRSPSSGEQKKSSSQPTSARRSSTGQQPMISLAVRRALEEKPPQAANGRVASPMRNLQRAPSPQTANASSSRNPSPNRPSSTIPSRSNAAAPQPKAPLSARKSQTGTSSDVVVRSSNAGTSGQRKTVDTSSEKSRHGAKPSTVQHPSPAKSASIGNAQPIKAPAPQAKTAAKLPPAANTGAAAAQGAPKAAPSTAIGCCVAFKAQWGNALCATCKHSRHAHQMLQARPSQAAAAAAPLLIVAPSSQFLDPTDSLGSPIPSRDASALGLSSGDRLDHVL